MPARSAVRVRGGIRMCWRAGGLACWGPRSRDLGSTKQENRIGCPFGHRHGALGGNLSRGFPHMCHGTMLNPCSHAPPPGCKPPPSECEWLADPSFTHTLHVFGTWLAGGLPCPVLQISGALLSDDLHGSSSLRRETKGQLPFQMSLLPLRCHPFCQSTVYGYIAT